MHDVGRVEGDRVSDAGREPDGQALRAAGRELVAGRRDEQRDGGTTLERGRSRIGANAEPWGFEYVLTACVVRSVTRIVTSTFVRPEAKNQKCPLSAQPSRAFTTISRLLESKNQK